MNPAAGGGRCGKLAKAALEKLRAAGVELEVAETSQAGRRHAAGARGLRARAAAISRGGRRRHGLRNRERPFPEARDGRAADAGLSAAGHRQFVSARFHRARRGARRRSHPCRPAAAPAMCLRLKHAAGEIYFINLLSMGFTADVTAAANRRFKRLGELGYILGVLVCLARLGRRAFPLRVEDDTEFDRRRCLFLTFNNSKFTGGKMMIAPKASTSDGLIEYVRWGPIGRLGLLRNFPTLFDGTHIAHPLASRRAVARVEFALDAPVDVMVDGEVFTLDCRRIEVLPGALDVLV